MKIYNNKNGGNLSQKIHQGLIKPKVLFVTYIQVHNFLKTKFKCQNFEGNLVFELEMPVLLKNSFLEKIVLFE